jgi:hypothetical protein
LAQKEFIWISIVGGIVGQPKRGAVFKAFDEQAKSIQRSKSFWSEDRARAHSKPALNNPFAASILESTAKTKNLTRHLPWRAAPGRRKDAKKI